MAKGPAIVRFGGRSPGPSYVFHLAQCGVVAPFHTTAPGAVLAIRRSPMIATAKPASRRESAPAWHRPFLALLSAIVRYASISFSDYPEPLSTRNIQGAVEKPRRPAGGRNIADVLDPIATPATLAAAPTKKARRNSLLRRALQVGATGFEPATF